MNTKLAWSSVFVLVALRAGMADAQVRQISAPLPTGVLGGVESFRLSPDGAWAVYRSDEVVDEVFELFAVPTDGSTAPMVLTGALVADGDVLGADNSFRTSPDSAFVAYLADQEADEVFELYVVPIDGSGAPLKLNDALVAGGDVVDFRFTPDGARIVYRADRQADESFELFSVPSDGSQTPVKLNGALVAGGDVASCESDASGLVAYLADELTDARNELFVVPADGSAASVRVNQPLDAGENVSAYRFAPGGARIVYRADQAANDVFELFSVPSDASQPPVTLNGRAHDTWVRTVVDLQRRHPGAML